MAYRTPINRSVVSRARTLARRASTTSRYRRRITRTRNTRALALARTRVTSAQRRARDAKLIAARIRKQQADKAALDLQNARRNAKTLALLKAAQTKAAEDAKNQTPAQTSQASRFALANPVEATKLKEIQARLSAAHSRSISVAQSLVDRIAAERAQSASEIAAKESATAAENARIANIEAQIRAKSAREIKLANENIAQVISKQASQIAQKRASIAQIIASKKAFNRITQARILRDRQLNQRRTARLQEIADRKAAMFARAQAEKIRQTKARDAKIAKAQAVDAARQAVIDSLPEQIAKVIRATSDVEVTVNGYNLTCVYKTGNEIITSFTGNVAANGGAITFNNPKPRAFWVAKAKIAKITQVLYPGGRYRYWRNRSYASRVWQGSWNWGWHYRGKYVEVKSYNLFAKAEKQSVAAWGNMVNNLTLLARRNNVNISGIVRM